MNKVQPPETRVVPLTSIRDHAIFKDHHECLVDDAYLLKIAHHLKPAAVELLFRLHPILTVSIKKQLTCIAGIRTLNIASQILPLDAEIPVLLFPKLTQDQIASYCYADILLTPLSLSIAGGGHFFVEKLLATFSHHCEPWTDLATCSKVDLARAFGLSRGGLYAHDRKQRN